MLKLFVFGFNVYINTLSPLYPHFIKEGLLGNTATTINEILKMK